MKKVLLIFFIILCTVPVHAVEGNVPQTFDVVQGFSYLPSREGTVHPDFQELYSQNPDIVGWLWAGENIDYPVMHRDNEYYLHHDFNGNDDENGTLFINELNLINPRDWLIIIHGHHMKSGAMFGRLQAYEQYSYVCRYPIIVFRTIYDEEGTCYVPVAGFNASVDTEQPDSFDAMEPWAFFWEELSRTIDWGAERTSDPTIPVSEVNKLVAARKEAFLRSALERSLWHTPLEISTDDQYLMLSTCSYYQEEGRFMLLCRKLRDDERPETISLLLNSN